MKKALEKGKRRPWRRGRLIRQAKHGTSKNSDAVKAVKSNFLVPF